MDLPPHLSAFGNAKENEFPAQPALVNGGNPLIAAKMNVPEKIVVGGSNKLLVGKPEIAEVVAERYTNNPLSEALNPPPGTLTVNELLGSDSILDAEYKRQETSRTNSISQNSAYVDEEEMSVLRLQLNALSSRVNKLEEKSRSKTGFNMYTLSASTIALIISILLLLRR